MNDFAPYFPINGSFIVLNTSPQIKTIKIFNYPINYMSTRNILQIPGVSESDIRASLLKGELNHKILAQDILVINSDIELLQFNIAQQAFLTAAGIINGLSVEGGGSGITTSQHEVLRQLIHFIDEGPGDGFVSGAYKVILNQPFPTNITWYTDNTTLYKIIEKLITYNGSHIPTIITWNVYNTDGITVAHSLTDTINYTNNIEISRTRSIS
ncbi:MAG TPA: hypothetical protein VII94_05895 [Candidatus Saccharimonadales bacterium]